MKVQKKRVLAVLLCVIFIQSFIIGTIPAIAATAPKVTVAAITNNPRPTWTWTTGGGGGSYQYQMDSTSGSWSPSNGTSYTPTSDLANKSYKLYVREKNGSTWPTSSSKFGSATVVIDTIAPQIVLKQSPISSVPTNEFVTVTATITDANSIATKEWALGYQPSSYFATGGTAISGTTFTATANNTYTVFAKDSAGNETTENIVISNIDTTNPVIALSQSPTTVTTGDVTITASISDKSGISNSEWAYDAKGAKDISYFYSAGNGTPIVGNTFSAAINGYYTVYAMDKAGNEQVNTISIGNIDKPTIKILEIEPSKNYRLSASNFSSIANVDLTQMQMAEFIGNIDQINGKYDVVYVGNNNSSENYTAVRTNQAKATENDITNKRAGNETVNATYNQQYSTDSGLRAFVKSKQAVIFDDTILSTVSTLKATKLYANFIEFKNNPAYPNFKQVSTSLSASSIANEIINNYNSSNKKPKLIINSKPTVYDGSDATYTTNQLFSYGFNMRNVTNSANSMVARLYLDINGDGLFKANEKVAENEPRLSGDNNSISFRLPADVVGLVPWKLEIEDSVNHTKNYEIGYTAIKGNPVTINVLQLVPPNNTFSINTKYSKLTKPGVYNINVTEMNVNDFNSLYPNVNTKAKITQNGSIVTATKPTLLNGNYDMLILGFADSYGGTVVASNTAVKNAIKDFIKTGQSAMFTHDTVWFNSDDQRYFKDIVGQSIYKDALNPTETNPDGTLIPHDQIPSPLPSGFSTENRTEATNSGDIHKYTDTDRAHKVNDGFVTLFPNTLGDISTGVPNTGYTHGQYFQLNLEDEDVVPWYTLAKPSSNRGGSTPSTSINDENDPKNFYYTYSKGNITYSGTGDQMPNDNQELDLFINTIIKASRTANHAPLLQLNLDEGYGISNQQPNLGFTFTPFDIDGDPVTGKVYVGRISGSNVTYTEVKSYLATDLPLGQTKNVSLTEAQIFSIIGSTTGNFKIKVYIEDARGAMKEEIRTVSLLDSPTVDLEAIADASGYLTGDTANITVKATARPSASASWQGFSPLNLIFNANPFQTINYDASAMSDISSTKSLNNVNYIWNSNIMSPQTPNIVQNNNLSFKLIKPNDPGKSYTVSGEIGYGFDKIAAPAKATYNFSISVLSGIIDVFVVDNNNLGIPNATVTVTKPDSTKITQTTDASGAVPLQNLCSGVYKISASSLNKASNITEQQVTLSYTNNKAKVTFKLVDIYFAPPSIVKDPSTEWSKDNVKVTLVEPSNFTSDVYQMQYKLDGGSWTDYNGIINLSNEGTFTVKARTILKNYDYTILGKYPDETTAIVKIDITNPVVVFSYDDNTAPKKTHSAKVDVTDANLDATKLYYIWNDSINNPVSGDTGWKVFTNGSTLTQTGGDGNYYLHIKAIDIAGNEAIVTSNSFKMDNTPPTIPSLSVDDINKAVEVNVIINYSSDSILKQYKIGNGSWQNYTGSIDIDTNCSVYARAQDEAGNQTVDQEIKINNIVPFIITTKQVNSITKARSVTLNVIINNNFINKNFVITGYDNNFVKITPPAKGSNTGKFTIAGFKAGYKTNLIFKIENSTTFGEDTSSYSMPIKIQVIAIKGSM